MLRLQGDVSMTPDRVEATTITMFNMSLCNPEMSHTDCIQYLRSREGNGTSDGEGGTLPVNFWLLILFVFPVVTLFGNLLVVISVVREKNLKNVTNYFIVSLAVADISLAVVVMPLAIWVEMNNGFWGYTDILCDFFIMFDVMFCTSSILNLAAISLDRFVAVTQPIKYSKHKNFKRIFITIGFTWVLSFGIALPIICTLNYTEHRIPGVCKSNNADYIIYSSLGSFYIPAFIMLILYYRIFLVIRKRAQRAKKSQRGQTFSNTCTEKPLLETVKKDKKNKSSNTSTKQTLIAYTQAPASHSTETCCAIFKHSAAVANQQIPGVQAALKTAVNAPSTSRTSESNSGSNDETAYVRSNSRTCDENSPHHNANGGSNSEQGSRTLIPLMESMPLVETHNLSMDTSTEFTDMTEFRKHLKARLRRARYGSLYQKKEVRRAKTTGAAFKFNNKKNPKKVFKASTVDSAPTVEAECVSDDAPGIVQGLKLMRMRLPGLVIPRKRRRNREKSSAKKERKATKTLAIVLGVFLLCWLPFFSMNMMDAICLKVPSLRTRGVFFCHLPGTMMAVAVWLGYINSFLNPIIYTIFNVEFRRAFKKILHIK